LIPRQGNPLHWLRLGPLDTRFKRVYDVLWMRPIPARENHHFLGIHPVIPDAPQHHSSGEERLGATGAKPSGEERVSSTGVEEVVRC